MIIKSVKIKTKEEILKASRNYIEENLQDSLGRDCSWETTRVKEILTYKRKDKEPYIFVRLLYFT